MKRIVRREKVQERKLTGMERERNTESDNRLRDRQMERERRNTTRKRSDQKLIRLAKEVLWMIAKR